jgi:hypothetical protein
MLHAPGTVPPSGAVLQQSTSPVQNWPLCEHCWQQPFALQETPAPEQQSASLLQDVEQV